MKIFNAAALILGCLAPIAVAATNDTTTVTLSSCKGVPALYGNGLLYGINGTTQPPQKYYSALKINYQSSGGAQVDTSPGGYATSLSSYKTRFATVVAAFKRIRSNGGVLIVKMADLWGADETTSSSFPMPGDDGNWTAYDNFLEQLVKDLHANSMDKKGATQLELWNEPDINFGGRGQSQFNAMWIRGVKTLRAEYPATSRRFLPLVGPSTSSNPGSTTTWWTNFLTYLQANGGVDVQPDLWNWHMEGGSGSSNDPIPPAQALPAYVEKYGLTTGIGLQNNEYGVKSQQRPGYSSWFFARYERLRIHGLRGNWEAGSKLNDYMADLLLKTSDGVYETTGDYQTHLYYANEMTGSPCNTTAGSNIDSFATASSGSVHALLGSRSFTGNATVVFSNITTYFPRKRSIIAKVYKIPYSSGAMVSGPVLNTTQTMVAVEDRVKVTIDIDVSADAWAIVLSERNEDQHRDHNRGRH